MQKLNPISRNLFPKMESYLEQVMLLLPKYKNWIFVEKSFDRFLEGF